MCEFGIEVSELPSLPPGKLVPESYPFELQ